MFWNGANLKTLADVVTDMETSEYHELRCAYEDAFQHLVVESGAVRVLADKGDDLESLEDARRRLAQATEIYRMSRDSLSAFLLRHGLH